MEITNRIRPVAVAAVAALALAAIGGCGSSDKPSSAEKDKAPASASASSEDDFVTVDEAWVKVAESGSTEVYGKITNGTANEVTVVSATSPVAGKVEVKEFSIPAKGNHELKPGGDHLTLTQLTKPVKAGDNVSVILTFKDKSTLQFAAAAK